jgi:hypothetical protein
VSNDLSTAKRLLESDFNKTITAFALPFGDFGERGKGSNYEYAHDILTNLTTTLYNTVFFQFSPTKDNEYRANYPDKRQDKYIVVRLSADILRNPSDLLREIEASRAHELPYIENYANHEIWPRISGDATFLNDSIVFKQHATDASSIMIAYLDGSYLWRDYLYSIDVAEFDGASVMMMARYATYDHYVACKYSPDSVRLLSVEGTSTVLSETAFTQNSSMQGATLGIKVKGSTASCLINGVEVLSAEAPAMPAYGGVALRAEGLDSPDKSLKVQNISAYPA